MIENDLREHIYELTKDLESSEMESFETDFDEIDFNITKPFSPF